MTNPISLDGIRKAFKQPKGQINLSDYYRGGDIVPDLNVYSSIPTSGEISLSDFDGLQIYNNPTGTTGSVAAGNRSAIVTASADDGGQSITSWRYRLDTWDGSGWDVGSFVTAPGVTGENVSFTISDLTNEQLYSIFLRPFNIIGGGDWSGRISFTPSSGIEAPSKPSLSLTAGDGQITISASVSDTGGSTPTQWQYRAKEGSGNYSSWTTISGKTGASLSWNYTGLTNDTEYAIRVRCKNSAGYSPDSDSKTATPTNTDSAPPKPSLTGGHSYYTFNLNYSVSSNGGEAITDWEYRWKYSTSNAYGSWTSTGDTGNSGSHSHIVTASGAPTVNAQVRCKNSIGYSPISNAISIGPMGSVLSKPAKPTLSVTEGDTQLSISGSTTYNGGAAISIWQYRYKTTGNYSSWTTITGETGNNFSGTITGLTNDTQYTVQVRCRNTAVWSDASDEETGTPYGDTVPVKPTLTLTGGDTQISLATSTTDDGGASITSWEYQYKAGTDSYGSWTTISGETGNSAADTITGLVNGTEYTFKTRCTNSEGTSPESDEQSATPASSVTIPNKPTLEAEGYNTTVDLAAEVASNGGASITEWQYRYKTTNDYGNWTTISGETGDSMEAEVTGLTNGTTYGFQVRAKNSSGYSPASDNVNATPEDFLSWDSIQADIEYHIRDDAEPTAAPTASYTGDTDVSYRIQDYRRPVFNIP